MLKKKKRKENDLRVYYCGDEALKRTFLILLMSHFFADQEASFEIEKVR